MVIGVNMYDSESGQRSPCPYRYSDSLVCDELEV